MLVMKTTAVDLLDYDFCNNEYGMKNGDRLSIVDPDSIPQAKTKTKLETSSKKI